MSLIGFWVTRKGLTRSHLVESEIVGDIVTHCGRRLTRAGGVGGEFQWLPTDPRPMCKQCDR